MKLKLIIISKSKNYFEIFIIFNKLFRNMILITHHVGETMKFKSKFNYFRKIGVISKDTQNIHNIIPSTSASLMIVDKGVPSVNVPQVVQNKESILFELLNKHKSQINNTSINQIENQSSLRPKGNIRKGRKRLDITPEERYERIRASNRRAQMKRREFKKLKLKRDSYIIKKDQIDFIKYSIEKIISSKSIADINLDKMLFIINNLQNCK